MVGLKKIAARIRDLLRSFIRFERFRKRFHKISCELSDGRFECQWQDRWPCLDDATGETNFDAHYIYHPAWAARKIKAHQPERHIDIGSKLDFVTLLSAFIPVEFYDYRPASILLSDLSCGRADLLSLPFADNSIASLSCMHVVEHVGLERYGDVFDPQGDLKAMAELARVVKPGGHLYFVVPLGGKARIQYNAHRIYDFKQVLKCFPLFELANFAFVADGGQYIDPAMKEDTNASRYGCGYFEFVKK